MQTPSCREAAPDQKQSGDPAAEQQGRQYRANGTHIEARKSKENKPQTTLGSSLFLDPLAGATTISEIRQRLELKYCACLASGGHNRWPLDVDRIKDSRFRALAGAGMTCKNWTIQDLVQCTDRLEGHATTVLMACLEGPAWGPDDLILMDLIERVESMRNTALGGGRTL